MEKLGLVLVVIVITLVVAGMIRNIAQKNIQGKGGTGINNPEPKPNKKPNINLTDDGL
jgi:hypothetical protein